MNKHWVIVSNAIFGLWTLINKSSPQRHRWDWQSVHNLFLSRFLSPFYDHIVTNFCTGPLHMLHHRSWVTSLGIHFYLWTTWIMSWKDPLRSTIPPSCPHCYTSTSCYLCTNVPALLKLFSCPSICNHHTSWKMTIMRGALYIEPTPTDITSSKSTRKMRLSVEMSSKHISPSLWKNDLLICSWQHRPWRRAAPGR